MLKNGNGLLEWLMVIPMIVIGCLVAVAYGVGCMIVWACMAIGGKGKKRVRSIG